MRRRRSNDAAPVGAIAGRGLFRPFLAVCLVLAIGLAWPASAQPWLPAIERFEAVDREHPPPRGAVLFVGSSSIRLWHSLEQDMAPRAVINRGFGGAGLADVVRYADRIVSSYEPSAVVLYAGENDLAPPASAATPEAVGRMLEDLIAAVRSAGLEVPILFLSIKPSPARWDRWEVLARANEIVAAMAADDPGLHFIDVASPLVAPSGEPDPALYAADGLHLNDAGYAAWSAIVRDALDRAAAAGPGSEATLLPVPGQAPPAADPARP